MHELWLNKCPSFPLDTLELLHSYHEVITRHLKLWFWQLWLTMQGTWIPLKISFLIHSAYEWLQVHTNFIAIMTIIPFIHIKAKASLAFMSFTIILISLTTICTSLMVPLSSKQELLPPLDASAASSFGVAYLINLSQTMHL